MRHLFWLLWIWLRFRLRGGSLADDLALARTERLTAATERITTPRRRVWNGAFWVEDPPSIESNLRRG